MIMIIICRRFFELVFVVSLSIGDLDYSSCHGSSDDICRPFLLFAGINRYRSSTFECQYLSPNIRCIVDHLPHAGVFAHRN